LAYASIHGQALVDRQLYLPRDWAEDPERRKQCHVPDDIQYQEKWQIAKHLLERSGPDLPHRWVVADDEFGRISAFRAWLRQQRKLYVLDAPSNTLVRDLEAPRPGGRVPKFETAQAWATRQPARRWKTITLRDGEKGPLRLRVLDCRVQTKEEGGCVGPSERLLVMRTLDAEPDITYALSNARHEPLKEVVGVGRQRYRIETLFQQGKGEVGLGHYEVRSWVGWHHHMTLSQLALWFLVLEKRRVGEKNPGHYDSPSAADFHQAPATAAASAGRNCRRDHRGAAAHRGGPHLSLLQEQQTLTPSPPRHKLRLANY
jgi:SRSO17 transposase